MLIVTVMILTMMIVVVIIFTAIVMVIVVVVCVLDAGMLVLSHRMPPWPTASGRGCSVHTVAVPLPVADWAEGAPRITQTSTTHRLAASSGCSGHCGPREN